MLVDLFRAICEQATNAQSAKLLDLPGNQKLLVLPNGETQEIHGNCVLVHDRVATFASVLEWAEPRKDSSLVFSLSDGSLICYCNREQPHLADKVQMALMPTQAIQCLQQWMSAPKTTRSVVQVLRSTLHGLSVADYTSVFKRVDFSRRNDGSKTVSHTGESLGKAIESQAQSSAGEIPEMMRFRLPLFTNIPVDSVELVFAVTVDADNETVAIAEVGDCIAKGIDSSLLGVREALKEKHPNAVVLY